MLFLKFSVVLLHMVVLVTKTEMHSVTKIKMQACGFCFLTCHDTACNACHHYHLYESFHHRLYRASCPTLVQAHRKSFLFNFCNFLLFEI